MSFRSFAMALLAALPKEFNFGGFAITELGVMIQSDYGDGGVSRPLFERIELPTYEPQRAEHCQPMAREAIRAMTPFAGILLSVSSFIRIDRIDRAICSYVLKSIGDAADQALYGVESPADRLRRLFDVLSCESSKQFFRGRKLHEIAAQSAAEDWASFVSHQKRVQELVRVIIAEGRARGEFECATPLDEVVRAISVTMQPFINPLFMQYNREAIPQQGASRVCSLVLRSLASSDPN